MPFGLAGRASVARSPSGGSPASRGSSSGLTNMSYQPSWGAGRSSATVLVSSATPVPDSLS
jgi:hypothetical protein